MVDFCDNEEWLAAYLDERLSGEERSGYEKHIAECAHCLTALLRTKGELDETTGALA
jgi:anti-sigma factor RsiW